MLFQVTPQLLLWGRRLSLSSSILRDSFFREPVKLSVHRAPNRTWLNLSKNRAGWYRRKDSSGIKIEYLEARISRKKSPAIPKRYSQGLYFFFCWFICSARCIKVLYQLCYLIIFELQQVFSIRYTPKSFIDSRYSIGDLSLFFFVFTIEIFLRVYFRKDVS